MNSLPIILPNAVTFFLSAPLLMMKLRYRESVKGAKTGPLRVKILPTLSPKSGDKGRAPTGKSDA